MENTITFTVNEFYYNIQYDDIADTVHISIMHNTEFIYWSKYITSDLIESSSDNIKLKITSKLLFNIFKDYNRGLLHDTIKIVLPADYKAQDIPLSIEITTKLPYYEDYCDTKLLIIDPAPISNEKRFELKLEHRDKTIKELSNSVESLKEKLNNFERNYNTFFDMVITDYYNKSESDNRYSLMGESYTKDESDNKYSLINTSHSKVESDNKHAFANISDTKSESNNKHQSVFERWRTDRRKQLMSQS
jgi:hypothetical protein